MFKKTKYYLKNINGKLTIQPYEIVELKKLTISIIVGMWFIVMVGLIFVEIKGL